MEDRNDQGMHPGVVNGRRVYPLSNTCGQRSKAKYSRAIPGMEKHIVENPRDSAAQVRLVNLKRRASE